MKTLRILLSLLLTLAVCAEEAEAQTRFKQLFQRKKRVPKERVLKSVKVDSIPVADSVSAVQIVRTESVAAEQQDSVATPQSKEKPYNPYLNVTLTPAQMDSLVARCSSPPLTCADCDMDALCEPVCARLDALLGGNTPESTLIPTHLNERDTFRNA